MLSRLGRTALKLGSFAPGLELQQARYLNVHEYQVRRGARSRGTGQPGPRMASASAPSAVPPRAPPPPNGPVRFRDAGSPAWGAFRPLLRAAPFPRARSYANRALSPERAPIRGAFRDCRRCPVTGCWRRVPRS